jgi:5-methylcytosine-specific restriction endonuclease McrA
MNLMDKSKQLETLRQQIKQRGNPAKRITPCPKCGKAVTIEDTDYFHVEICEHCLEYSKIEDIGKCCSNPSESPAKLITSSGVAQVRMQCSNCGNVKGSSIGGCTKEQREALPLINIELKEKRSSIINQFYTGFRERLNNLRGKYWEQQHTDWLKEYNKYLQSPEWREKRTLVLKRDGYICQACLDNTATQVHHKSYQFVDLSGNEPCFDLVAICTPCHERIEAMKKQIRQ